MVFGWILGFGRPLGYQNRVKIDNKSIKGRTSKKARFSNAFFDENREKINGKRVFLERSVQQREWGDPQRHHDVF